MAWSDTGKRPSTYRGRKEARHERHIRQKGKGSWQIQIYTGTGRTVSAAVISRQYTAANQTHKSADRATSQPGKGVYTPPGRLTVAEHLHKWLEGYVKTNCSAHT